MTQTLKKLGIHYPIIQGPMAGFAASKLAAAVSNAGGLGALGGGLLTPEQLQKTIREIRTLTNNTFAINLFAPTSSANPTAAQVMAMNSFLDRYRKELGLPLSPAIQFAKSIFAEQLEVVFAEKPHVFSFTFNILPADIIKKLKQLGIIVIGTATTVREAVALEKTGVDFIVAQGYEAGGHRGTPPDMPIADALIGTMALVPQIIKNVKTPVIASGGIMNGKGILAALMLGASAVQMGTAFLTADEATIHPKHKEALLQSTEDHTCLTRVFTGRYARGIKNRFTTEMEAYQDQCLAYPYQRKLTADIKNKATEMNNPDFMNLWSGQAASLCETKPAGELIKSWMAEMEETLAGFRERIFD